MAQDAEVKAIEKALGLKSGWLKAQDAEVKAIEKALGLQSGWVKAQAEEEENELKEAKRILAGLRLNINSDNRDALASLLVMNKRLLRDKTKQTGGWKRLNKQEQIRKRKQLSQALQKAKKLYVELHAEWWGPGAEAEAWACPGACGPDALISNTPPCQVSRISQETIEFTRDPDDSRLSGTSSIKDTISELTWPLQIIDYVEQWADSTAAGLKYQPAWNNNTIKQNCLRIVAYHCHTYGIRISAAENSQFYKIAEFLIPDTSDLRYRIKSLIDNLGGEFGK